MPRAKKAGRAQRARNIVAETRFADTTLTRPTLPTAPWLNTRAPFFAAQLKKVCRATKVAAACYRGQTKLTRKKLGVGGRAPEQDFRDACTDAGGKMREKYVKSIRAGKVELDFLSPAQAKKLDTLPGPNLRLCARDSKQGYLVPVSGPDVAAQLRDAFVDCVKGKKSNMPACALQAAQKATGRKNPALGGFVQTRGFTSSLFSR
jgi:hypothetical protein